MSAGKRVHVSAVFAWKTIKDVHLQTTYFLLILKSERDQTCERLDVSCLLRLLCIVHSKYILCNHKTGNLS